MQKEISKITAEDISHLYYKETDSKAQPGEYLTDGEKLFRVDSYDKKRKLYLVTAINPVTFEEMDCFTDSISEDSEYYCKLRTSDIASTRQIAQRILSGEQIMEKFDESDENALMTLSNKQSLLSLQETIEHQKQVVETTMTYCKLIQHQMMRDIEERIGDINEVVKGMNREINKLMYVVTTIETYAGISEEIRLLKDGPRASEDTPIVIRQAVMFMDEELALIDDDFDWRKRQKFEEWLVENDRFKTLLPDEKSVVAIKPRRYKKNYASNDGFYDAIMNKNNFVTSFLIRNGESLYRIDSEHIYLEDRMFPNPNEYMETLEKEAKESRGNEDDKGSDRMRRRFTQVGFLLQGLLDRSDVLSPHHVQCSFLKLTGIDGKTIIMNYELDESRLLKDSRPTIDEWINNLNQQNKEGSRIILLPKYDTTYAGYEFLKHDFKRYYNDYSCPDYPGPGVYSLKYDKEGHWYNKDMHFYITYLPKNDTYSWTEGFCQRKNRVTLFVHPYSRGVLNYDNLNIDDLDYYLNSRLYRSQYYYFIRMLKLAKDVVLYEKKQEDEFVMMMYGELLTNGLKAKDGFRTDDIIRKAIDIVKSRLKWKRPISSKEKETYFLVKKTLMSEAFKKKYFVYS